MIHRHTRCESVGELAVGWRDIGLCSTTVFSWTSIVLCLPGSPSSVDSHHIDQSLGHSNAKHIQQYIHQVSRHFPHSSL